MNRHRAVNTASPFPRTPAEMKRILAASGVFMRRRILAALAAVLLPGLAAAQAPSGKLVLYTSQPQSDARRPSPPSAASIPASRSRSSRATARRRS